MAAIRPLTSADAPAIAALEARFHDRSLIDGEARIRMLLEAVEYQGIQHSFGLFDDANLVGYLLSYGLQSSELPKDLLAGKAMKEAVYVEDVAILEPWRRHFLRLFDTFLESVRNTDPGLPLEAIGIEPLVRGWQKQERWALRMGYRLDVVMPVGEVIDGHERFLIRWESTEPRGDEATCRARALAGMDSMDCRVGPHNLKVRSLRREEHLDLLAADWERLLVATPGHTAFQTLNYQRLWLKHFWDQRLLVLLVFEDEQLIGIAPFTLGTLRRYGQTVNQLGFIGSRWEADRPVLLFGARFDDCLAACLQYLLARRSLWQRAYFYEQVDDERLRLIQDGFRRAGYLVGSLPDSLCPTIRISGTWTAFMAGKSRKFRKNLEAAEKKLRAIGDLHYAVHTEVTATLKALDTHRDLESRSWKAAAGVGIGRCDAYFEFYRELATVLTPQGHFVTRTLSAGGQPVASTFGLLFNRSFFSLQIVHDDAFSKASPGTYLESLELKECFEVGLQEYDFLGGFLNNKSRWTDDFRQTHQVFVYDRRPYHVALYLWAFHLKPFLKARYQRLRPKIEALRSRFLNKPPASGEDQSS